MTQVAEIKMHLADMSELLNIVGAMRSLAGMRVQEAQRELPGVRRYADAVASAIGDTLLFLDEADLPPAGRGTRSALVLCMAEHGFIGGFNELLLESVPASETSPGTLFILGSRGAAYALERGRRADWVSPMATRYAAALEVVRVLTTELYRRIARGEVDRVEVMFARHRQGSVATIERRLLLPLDIGTLRTKQPRQAPLHNLRPVVLQERLIAEYVFGLLTEAVVESIASENAARLVAMEAARDNVSRKLEQLRQDMQQARQSGITTEIVELIAAAKAFENARS